MRCFFSLSSTSVSYVLGGLCAVFMGTIAGLRLLHLALLVVLCLAALLAIALHRAAAWAQVAQDGALALLAAALAIPAHLGEALWAPSPRPRTAPLLVAGAGPSATSNGRTAP